MKIYEIADLKIRDTYSFVSVIKGCEGKLFKLKGVILGKREVTIQEAREEEKPQKQNAPAQKKGECKSAKGNAGKKSDGKKGKSQKSKNNNSKNKPHTQSNKSRLTQMFEDELNYSTKYAQKSGKKKK